MTKVKIVNKSGQPVPAYATPLSAGMDLRACLDAPVTLGPLERTLVPTGLFIALPAGYEAQVRPRSGLAAKHGITVLNTPGTIEADRADGRRPPRAGGMGRGRYPGRDGARRRRLRQHWKINYGNQRVI